MRGTLAEALRRRGETTAAAAEHARALALAGDDAQGWYNLAAAWLEAARPKDADWALAEALRLDPQRADSWNLLGVLRSRRGEREPAVAAFRRALELAPAHAGAATNLGHALRELGDFAEAESAYRRALELDPGSADAENGFGALEIARDRPAAAVPHLQRALELAPKQHEARLNLAIAFDLSGAPERAAAAYRDFLSSTAGDRRFDEQRRAAEQLLARLTRDAKRVPPGRAPGRR
jgi:Flp pilus assembly protein TadD